MDSLKIEYIDINSIKPYKKNAKLHPQEQIEQIKKSIQEFGMNDPIGIWKDEIVEGHGRLLACKELEYTEIPIIRLDHLTDEQRKAYILAHNKLTMNSDFDIDILNEELDNILDIDMSDFGFDLGILDSDEFGTDFELPDGDKAPFMQLTFTLSNEQAEEIKDVINEIKKDKSTINSYNNYGNDNANGNALYTIIKEWEKQKI